MNMELSEFLSIAIVGVVLSGIVAYLKSRYGTTGWRTKTLTVVLSIVVGTAYYFLQGTDLLQNVVGVLAASSTVYALIINK